MLFMWYSKTNCALVYPDFPVAFGFLERFCPEESRKLASHLENIQTVLSMKTMSGAYYNLHVGYGSDSKQSSMMCQPKFGVFLLKHSSISIIFHQNHCFGFYLVTVDHVTLAVKIMHSTAPSSSSLLLFADFSFLNISDFSVHVSSDNCSYFSFKFANASPLYLQI